MLLLLLACASDSSPGHDAALDADNWLEGSFVDEFQPELEAVYITVDQSDAAPGVSVDTNVQYVGVLEFKQYGPGADNEPPPHASWITSPLVDVASIDALTVDWRWDAEWSEISGTFDCSFTTADGDVFDVTGAYSGVPSRSGSVQIEHVHDGSSAE